jgi:hypothetical protein
MAKTKVSKKTTDESVVKPVTTTTDAAPAAPALETAATEPKPSAKKIVSQPAAESETSKPKPTLVKSEPRANLVPINLEDEIRRLAYLMSERRGFAPGHENEDWLAAEYEVRQRYHQQSAQQTA